MAAIRVFKEPSANCQAGVGSVVAKILDAAMERPQNRRLARRGLKGVFGQVHQGLRMESGGQPLQPYGGDPPVAIAAGAPQKIYLPRGALQKRRAQFVEKRRIVSRRGSQSSVETSRFVSHGIQLMNDTVNRRFIARDAVFMLFGHA